jgi:hypothetical protein
MRVLKWFGIAAVVVLAVLGALVLFVGAKEKVSPPKPDIPITVKHRPALLDQSRVCVFTNTSTRTLLVQATFENPTTKNRKVLNLSFDPNGVKQIGHMEGWGFHSGDKINLHHAEYSDWNGSVP